MTSRNDLKRLGEQLHQRMLAGPSVTVTSEIAEKFLPPLVRSLRWRFSQVTDPDLIDTAAEDALLYYLDQPVRFDPARSSLLTFLLLRARGYLLNSMGRSKASTSVEKVVELDDPETVYKAEAENQSIESVLIEQETESGVMHQLSEIITDPIDFQVIMLMLEGVRDTKAFAEVMGIAHLPTAEQARLVKKSKDRLKKTVQRKFKREDG